MDPSGRQVLNLLYPLGSPLPSVAESRDVPANAPDRRAAGLGSRHGPDHRPPGDRVTLPLLRDGKIRHVLVAVMTPESFASVLAAAHIADGTVGTIVDRNGVVVATTQGQEQRVGQAGGPPASSRAPASRRRRCSPGPRSMDRPPTPRSAAPRGRSSRWGSRSRASSSRARSAGRSGCCRRRRSAPSPCHLVSPPWAGDGSRAACAGWRARSTPSPAARRCRSCRIHARRARKGQRGSGRGHGAHADPDGGAAGVGAALPHHVRAQSRRDVPDLDGRAHRGLQRGLRPDPRLRAPGGRAGDERRRAVRPAEGARSAPRAGQGGGDRGQRRAPAAPSRRATTSGCSRT